MDKSFFLIFDLDWNLLDNSSSNNDKFINFLLKEIQSNNSIKQLNFDEKIYKISHSTINKKNILFIEEKRKDLEKIINLGEMSSGMAHDINNSLSMIMSSFELVKFEIEDQELEIEEKYLENVEYGISQISNIVDGVLSFCRNDQNMNRKINLIDLFRKIEIFSNSYLKKSQINLELVYTNKNNFDLTARDTLLYQVFTNLIKNSHDAIKNLPKFSRWINIEIKEDVDLFHIKFIDGGSGIPLEIQDKIFENLYTTKEAGEGTGIGLFFCKKVIEAHNGTIEIDNNSKNTCFYIKLPKTKE